MGPQNADKFHRGAAQHNFPKHDSHKMINGFTTLNQRVNKEINGHGLESSQATSKRWVHMLSFKGEMLWFKRGWVVRILRLLSLFGHASATKSVVIKGRGSHF